ncbi:amidohydrolase [Massilia sp. WF1]|uniref:M20 family metallopeptidase n=1 Tax=unclassified Massilia TaxID=2609279 RepID=UPI00064AFAF6|nr:MULTISPECIES: M20 family metallopeptidase [unclassified Massilia]ALK97927.1 amidohydrolase [Massilia sp. WG5]KLU36973.1 amidohydrolase [Massilia sp. WF1]
MNDQLRQAASQVLAPLGGLLPALEALYTDVHAHPELSMQEHRTAGLAAERLRAAGYEVTTGVGGTGVVGVLRNGPGPTVMLRADMDALPIAEATGLPYASTVTATDREGKTVPVMHACGHDMHVAWLAGAATLLAQARQAWSGTLAAVFQPGEETAEGARAMLDDGLYKYFPKPDVVLGQHVMVASAGEVGGRTGTITSAADSMQIRLFGRGAHGSMPQAAIDPVVMAAATVMRLQTIVSRELSPNEAAVVTVGSLQAGTKENVIPDEAIIKLNVRSYDPQVRKRVLDAIERIVNAEAAASGAPKPPEFTMLDSYPMGVNDGDASGRVGAVFRQYFAAERVHQTGPTSASEDFGSFGLEWKVPAVFWFVGGTDPAVHAKAKAAGEVNKIPSNHSPFFAPVLHPTLETGIETMVVAALAWLAGGPPS